MDKQQVLSEIELIVEYEQREHAEDYDAGLIWDVGATRDAIFEWLMDDEYFLDTVGKMRTDWEIEEYVHLCALGYFSSYEPVFRQVENV